MAITSIETFFKQWFNDTILINQVFGFSAQHSELITTIIFGILAFIMLMGILILPYNATDGCRFIWASLIGFPIIFIICLLIALIIKFLWVPLLLGLLTGSLIKAIKGDKIWT